MIISEETGTLAAQRVARGAQLLDQVKPGWRDGIDPERLDIEDHHDCVLGQLYGDYFDGREIVFEDVDYMERWWASVDHGFLWDWDGISPEALNEAWTAEILG